MPRSPETRLGVTALLVALVLLATGCGTLSEVMGPPQPLAPPPIAAEDGAPETTPDTPAVTSMTDNTAPLRSEPTLAAVTPEPPTEQAPESPAAPSLVTAQTELTELAAGDEGTGAAAEGMAQARETQVIEPEPEDYDPWEPYNERMFAFNYNVDRYVLKPAANVYRHIVPEPFQIMISNGFDNIRFPARFVNLVLQGRFWGAFLETSRFVINSTLGVGGLFNPATDYFGIPRSSADFGQTLAGWGVGPGPFFVPPFLPPATVRDFIGRLADSAMNPIAWFLIDFWPEGLAIGVGEMVNQRAVTYELFQGVEETTLDLYTAVRDGYLRRRERQLQRLEE